jgi:hypothetical protein
MSKEDRTVFDYEKYFLEWQNQDIKTGYFDNFVLWIIHSDKGTEFLEKINELKRHRTRELINE